MGVLSFFREHFGEPKPKSTQIKTADQKPVESLRPFEPQQKVIENTHNSKTVFEPEEVQKTDKELLEEALNIDDLASLWDGLKVGDPLLPLIIEKLSKINEPWSVWLDSYDNRSSDEIDDDFSKALIIKALDLSSDISELESVWDNLPEKSPQLDTVLSKLCALENSFSEWSDAYENRDDDDDFARALLKKALEKATVIGNYVSLYNMSENAEQEDDSKLILEAVKSKTWTKEQWEEVRDDIGDINDLWRLSIIKLLEMNTGVVNLLKFYNDYRENYSEDDMLLKAIAEKIFSVATRQEVQIIYLLSHEDDDFLKDKADEFLKS